MSDRSNAAVAVIVALLTLAACHGGAPPSSPTSVVAPLPTFTLTGIVRESLTTGPGAPIRDAVVQMIGKPGVIASTRSDADGRFRFTDVAGQFQVSASRAGYRTATVTVGPVTADTTKDIGVEPIVRTIAGRVVEAPPTQTKGVAGARVEIVSGAGSGRSVTTDAGGTYTLSDVWGDIQVRASAAGYTAAVQAVSIADGDTVADVQLAPEPRVITESVDGATLPESSPYFSRTIDVHNTGEIAVTDLSFYGFEEGDSCALELWEAGQMIVRNVVERSFPRNTTALRVPVLAGHRYELRARPFYLPYFKMTFRHPS